MNLNLNTLKSQAVGVAPLSDRDALRILILGVTGVYVLVNKRTGNIYIGSSKNVYYRVQDYTQPAYQADRSTHPIVRALVKYGIDAFDVYLLTVVATNNLVAAREAEQVAIDTFKPAYNQLKKVESSIGFKHTDATKLLLSSQAKGRVRSEESKSRQSASVKGIGNPNYGKPMSDEQKQKLREYALTREWTHGTAVEVVNTATGTQTWYRSISAASYALPYSRRTITNALANGTLLGRHIYIRKALSHKKP